MRVTLLVWLPTRLNLSILPEYNLAPIINIDGLFSFSQEQVNKQRLYGMRLDQYSI